MVRCRLASALAFALVLGPLGAAEATVLTHTQAQAGALNCFPSGVLTDNFNPGGSFAESTANSDLHGSYAYASASLATGKLRFFGSNATSGGCPVAGGTAIFQDLITIDLPDGMTSAEVEFSLAVSGASSSPSAYDLGFGNLNIDGVGTSFANGQINLADMYGRTLRYSRTVTDGEEIDIHVHMNAYRLFDAGTIDLMHTGAFGLILPDGVTFTSESGVLLTQAGGIPEPGPWALLILGFATAGAALRRGRLAATPRA